MLEVDCPHVTPEVILKASGNVDKFTDLMVKDEKTGTCYRTDHLLKDFCQEKLEKDPVLSSEKAAEVKHVLAVFISVGCGVLKPWFFLLNASYLIVYFL
jgi:glycyl-tRNA synthetase